jgi:filamentous hemagglutinin family protein
MTQRTELRDIQGARRVLLLVGSSLTAMTVSAISQPARAQMTSVRSVRSMAPTAPVTAASVTLVRSPNMQQALVRQRDNFQQADSIRGYVTAARDAALAATRLKRADGTLITDGLGENGLDPIAAIRQAVAAAKGGDTTRANQLLVSVSAASDTAGNNTWQGAGLPTQTVADGKVTVNITQNESRALLSWNRFDVGSNTTLNFDQSAFGTGATVVNRVVDSIAPSTILGAVKAQGTAVVLNSRGVVFGQNSQVNLNSLLVSTLELGAAAGKPGDIGLLKKRNDGYLENGLFPSGRGTPYILAPFFAGLSDSPLEGTITLDPGAQVTAGSGGFIILAGPKVESSGVLRATDGQVSLQGGRYITAIASTGGADSIDPDVRGYVLNTLFAGRDSSDVDFGASADDGLVINHGLIVSSRGYISLGAALKGEVINGGLLSATTSVSRNGKIALTAGTVSLAGAADPARAAGIVISADDNGETIPQGTADARPSFKSSKIVIGARDRLIRDDGSTDTVGKLAPGIVNIGENSLILAPGADLIVGRSANVVADPLSKLPSHIDVRAGAVIDVSGLKDVQLAAGRNSLQVTPVKRNELRDTPTYREVSLGDNFTLNGTTLYVDPRLSGVRSDGVKWIGSPLIEAGSLASQIPVTAAELMTRGGNVTLSVGTLIGAIDPKLAPYINIAKSSLIDFSGGWVNYAAGTVRTSKLITDDGRIVDIGAADPNDVYVAIANGYTEAQPAFGVSDTYRNVVRQGARVEDSYDEGRDAGSLIVTAPAINVEGSLDGNAFAGARQRSDARQPGRLSTLTGDTRKLQNSASQLPAGGLLQIGSFSGGNRAELGADIVVFHGTRGATPSPYSQTLLSDDVVNSAGLSALTLQTSGSVLFAGANPTRLQPDDVVTLTGASNLRLAAGGVLTVDSGRSIRFDGKVTAPSGQINARTAFLSRADDIDLARPGSPFRADDDLAPSYLPGASLPRPFDIDVTGTLSTAGLFVNDLLATDGFQGSAWRDGGSISLATAPGVFGLIRNAAGAVVDYADISGSITVAKNALLNVSAGAYVSPTRALLLNAKSGNVSLINETIYAPIGSAGVDQNGNEVLFNIAKVKTPSVARSTVSFDEASIKGFGFSGGGTFTLVSPNISFGSESREGSSHISLDFYRKTGFGTLDTSTYRASVFKDFFGGGRNSTAAILETTMFAIKNGETFDLTQSLFPSLATQGDAAALEILASGSDVTSILTAGVAPDAWDRKAANLTLRGLTELDVEQGGKIVGAAEAVIITPKLFNAGSIVLHAGQISQQASLPSIVASRGFGLKDTSAATLNGVFGSQVGGKRSATDANSAGLQTTGLEVPRPFTNEELAGSGFIYALGRLAADEGVRLVSGSVTDLSGVALFNPRTTAVRDGTPLLLGRILGGGSISTASAFAANLPFLPASRFGTAALDSLVPTDLNRVAAPRSFNAQSNAVIDLTGVSAEFDILTTPTAYARALQWSNGGTLSILGGGTIAAATIKAEGGAPGASGGTLEWLNPIIRQTYASGGNGIGAIYANQIASAGFDSLVARGGVTFDGAVSLALDKSFIVSSAPLSAATSALGAGSPVVIAATAGTKANLTAPYIRFDSRVGKLNLTALPQKPNSGSAEVAFNAGGAGIDFVGAVLFNDSLKSTRLNAAGDVRFTGVDNRATTADLPLLNGELVSEGNLTFDAARVFATTGTGNLQRILEDQRAGRLIRDALPYEIFAPGNSTIRFEGSHIGAQTPLSAGSYLRVQAKTIEQNGYLAAPLGLLELGGSGQASVAGQVALKDSFGKDLFPGAAPRAVKTDTLTFGAASVTTVSGAGVSIPYGTTSDLNEYFFTPTVADPITSPPTGQLTLTGGAIDVKTGATVDGRGGGDVFAYEFVSGVGGSRDVLDRINRDQFSSNGFSAATGSGFLFADRRQVFAILPADRAQALGLTNVALFDPLYSADYGVAGPVDLYGTSAGLSVKLDAAPGIAAGEYVLLPAHYALFPGALRIVENTGLVVPALGQTQSQLDGSIIVGGSFATAGTALGESQRRSFTVQSKSSFSQYSRLETTDAAPALVKLAQRAGTIVPRLPLDSARVILSPLTSLKVAGVFKLDAATGGQGTKIDIGGANIILAGDTAPPTAGALTLTNSTLANLNANSLFIGGRRTDNGDGSTILNILAENITVKADAKVSAPELLFAVGAAELSTVSDQPHLTVEDGAQLIAAGTLDDVRVGDLIIKAIDTPPAVNPFALTGIGAALRVANGPERLFKREGDFVARTTLRPATLKIGAATLTGANIALDSSRNFVISDAASFVAPNIAVSGDTLRFAKTGLKGEIEAKFAAANRLTLRSPDAIGFSSGVHSFNNLVIDAPAIARVAIGAVQSAAPSDVTINANNFTWSNSAKDFAGCLGTAFKACGAAGGSLAINANEVAFGSGGVGVYGFNNRSQVSLTARNGIYIEGTGSLSVRNEAGSPVTTDSSLTLTTPFLADRSAIADPSNQPVRADYRFTTGAKFTLQAVPLAVGAVTPQPSGNRTPGARIAIGSIETPVANAVIDGASILATAGVIDIRSAKDVTLRGNVTLSTPGYSKRFGDDVDSTTVSAGGGAITLVALNGNITLPGTATLIVDSYDGPNAKGQLDRNDGRAGAINLFASRGAIDFSASLNPGVVGTRDSSLAFDAEKSAFDLTGFVKKYGSLFQGDLDIRSGAGNLALSQDLTIRATSVKLTTDGGKIDIAGKIDTSGLNVNGISLALAKDMRVNGGNIALFGDQGITLASTAKLDTHTSGYLDEETRVAKAGDVTLGIGSQTAALTIADGAVIDVGARRPSGQSGNRLIAQTVKEPGSLNDVRVYRFAEADQGGTVLFRAPVDDATSSRVNIVLPSAIPVLGANSIQIEGFKRYDLDALAKRSETLGDIAGIYRTATGVSLDLTGGADDTDDNGNPYPYFFTPNILAGDFVTDDGLSSLVHFIHNFAISSKDGSRFAATFRQRPGVELISAGTIEIGTVDTPSNWNLGAGTVDVVRALRDKVLLPIPQLDGGRTADGLAPYLSVAPGQDANLFQNYTTLLYRVGNGPGNASGEAPFVTLRAGKSLSSNYSITDGFFTFRDRSDPFYMSYQLGGGDRKVLPAAVFTCGGINSGDCSAIVQSSFVAIASDPNFPANRIADPTQVASINLTTIVGGADIAPNVAAPYSFRANSAAAQGALNANFEETGNPIGAADPFPLLNNGLDFAKSSSLRLVGGAGSTNSANPLHVDRGTQADVSITGEHSYAVVGTRGTSSYAPDPLTRKPILQLRIQPIQAGGEAEFLSFAANREFIENAGTAGSSSGLGLDVESQQELYTVLNWGVGTTARAAYVRAKAAAYFHYIQPGSYSFGTYGDLNAGQRDALQLGIPQGPIRTPSGVAARLNDILGFLASIDPANGKTIGENFAANVLNFSFPASTPISKLPISFGGANKAYYGSLVRTGDGSVNVAAANDVKLLRTDEIVYRNEPNFNLAEGSSDTIKYQVGGTAVYTVGHQAVQTALNASTGDDSVRLNLAWGAGPNTSAFDIRKYLPSPKEQFLNLPVLLTGGGAVDIAAGGDVNARRDVLSEKFRATGTAYDQSTIRGDAFTKVHANTLPTNDFPATSRIGAGNQLWRTGTIGQDSLIAIAPQYFSSGIGALGGGNVSIKAGGAISGLVVALDTSVVTANSRAPFGENTLERFGALTSTLAGTTRLSPPVLVTLGHGNLEIDAGSDLTGGQIDVASGLARIRSDGDIKTGASTTFVNPLNGVAALADSLRIRITDATASIVAQGSVDITSVNALGAGKNSFGGQGDIYRSAGNFSAVAGADIVAIGAVNLAGDKQAAGASAGEGPANGFILAPSLGVASLVGDIVLTAGSDAFLGNVTIPYLLYPSRVGQLSLLAGGSIKSTALAMLDSDPSLLPGIFSASIGQSGDRLGNGGLSFFFPGVTPITSDAILRLYHSQNATHANDPTPARIYADGSIRDVAFSLPKQARIAAGLDIVNLFFVGQNLGASETTRITAGRDITGTTSAGQAGTAGLRQFVVSNSITLGGRGALSVEAGRDLGPFVTSATVEGVSYSGGIRTVGNEQNPWLKPEGAGIFAAFGVGKGVDYSGLRETYLNPANAAKLDGDLFVQITDVNGNAHPDRTRPVYAPILAKWLRDNRPEAFAAVFGGESLGSDAALEEAAYQRFNNLYAAFNNLPQIEQNGFLVNQLYFGELAQPSIPTGPSFQQYIRGYRAVEALFPTRLGYTDNLAAYTTDPSTVSADHPLGVPRRKLDAKGQPVVAAKVETGNVDLRLATIETARGGDVTLLGPGGNFIAGSVVRTSAQLDRKGTRFGQIFSKDSPFNFGNLLPSVQPISAVPLGFEGILTLRGGAIRGFTDGDFRLNQSRLFTQAGGDITLWSSNGDLNAGQGAKSASNFPPITVRFNPDGLSEVDSAGSVAGAGIGAFKPTPTTPDSSIILVAPVGEVDAGDAGVRASGNVFVAAARVANADNFKAGGSISGVPTIGSAAATAPPPSAQSAVTAAVAKVSDGSQTGKRTIITVDVLGYSGSDPCGDPNSTDASCKK